MHTTTRAAEPLKTAGDMVGTNFPMSADGKVYHLALGEGELANDMIIVGDPNRAMIVAKKFLTPDPKYPELFPHTCTRGFTVYTGYFGNRRVSVCGTGMGFSMIDFFVREARAIVKGPMRIIRLGSCGTPQENITVGTIVAFKRAFGVYADHRPYAERKVTGTKYEITNSISADSKLHSAMMRTLSATAATGAFTVKEGDCASAEFFYSTQGRQDPSFPDDNQGLIQAILEKHPETSAFEMEASYLFDLAETNTSVAGSEKGISAAGCAIVLAARKTGVFLGNDEKHRLEEVAGLACLNALNEP